MTALNLWDTFYSTGRVNDYLSYCREAEGVGQSAELREREQGAVEVFDRRTDNKRN